MGVSISNDAQLLSIFKTISDEVITSLTSWLIKELRAYISVFTYKTHGPNKVYVDSYEFLFAWTDEEIENSMRSLATKIYYDPTKLTADIERWKHGSVISGDVTAGLPDILNRNGLSSSLWISVAHAPFWDKFLEEVVTGGKLDNQAAKLLASYGFRRA